jgi:quercetin dioxygenase-like cupin family protein
MSYTYFADLAAEAKAPEKGILSRTLHNDDSLKVVLFGFAAGEELSAHTAPMPATIYFVSGAGKVKLGNDSKELRAGTFAYMAPILTHAIQAVEPTLMLLMIVKAAAVK